MSAGSKRRASRSLSPSDERADAGPMVLRRARANAPSLADLPTEMLEVVLRCAAESTQAVVRMALTCRALERAMRACMPSILIDHGLMVLRNGRWEFIHDVLPASSTTMWRGHPLSRYLATRLPSIGLFCWLKSGPNKMMEMASWKDSQLTHLAPLLRPWPTAAYRARVEALSSALIELDFRSQYLKLSPKFDLLCAERLLVELRALFDGSHAAARAVHAAAAEHPSLFPFLTRVSLCSEFAQRLFQGEPSLDDAIERLRTISAIFSEHSRQIGMPTSVLRLGDDVHEQIIMLMSPTKTTAHAVALQARQHIAAWTKSTERFPSVSYALDPLTVSLVDSGRGDLIAVFEQASLTYVGRQILRELHHMVTGADIPDQADILAHLLPHYLGALRGCVPGAP